MTKEARTSAQHQANLEDQIKTKILEKQLGALNPGKLATLATTAGQSRLRWMPARMSSIR